MPDMFTPTRAEILAEVARELGMRRNVFPKWIEAGKIKPDVAERRIALLQVAYDFLCETLPRDGSRPTKDQ
jgi:hypothetical protein